MALHTKICPYCGATMQTATGGWVCPICGLTADFNGGVHMRKEAPTMAYKTRGDSIRAMSDLQLAKLFDAIMAKQRNQIMEALHAKGIIEDMVVIEVPIMTMAAHLRWLREPAEEEDA